MQIDPKHIDYEALDLRANKGAFSTYDAEVLVPEVMKLEPGEIYLEVGVDRGKSLSIAKMVAKEGVGIFGVDLRDDPNVEGTFFHQGDSVAVAKLWDGEASKISVLFIDGDHSYEGCKRDIDAWYPHLKEGATILFHDCDETSPGVVQAVAEAYQKYNCKNWKLYKREDKNTSMAQIWI